MTRTLTELRFGSIWRSRKLSWCAPATQSRQGMLEHRLNTIKRSSDAQNENWANSIRDAAMTYWHETCTGKMGRDDVSVVDGRLKVYGVENLRIANGSILPRVTSGNTMAPCVITTSASMRRRRRRNSYEQHRGSWTPGEQGARRP